jgi:CRISPR-associated protein Csd2
VTTTKEADEQIKKHGDITGTLGRKSIVPYGLYATQGFISPQEAAGTGFTEADLDLLLRALAGRARTDEIGAGTMFDLDRSASRGLMAAQKLFVFKHSSKLGNAPAHKLFGTVKVELAAACKANGGVPRAFTDYTVTLDRSAIPATVEVIELL